MRRAARLRALRQRRERLLARSQDGRAAVAAAGAAAARRLWGLDAAWRAAVAVARHPLLLALPGLAWAWWAARRVAPPQSGAADVPARWPAPAAGPANPAAARPRGAPDTKGRR